jgi:hypothetical protein
LRLPSTFNAFSTETTASFSREKLRLIQVPDSVRLGRRCSLEKEVAAAKVVYEKGREQGRGRKLDV